MNICVINSSFYNVNLVPNTYIWYQIYLLLKQLSEHNKVCNLGVIASLYCLPTTYLYLIKSYSTVTDFAKLRGWSTSVPLIIAT